MYLIILTNVASLEWLVGSTGWQFPEQSAKATLIGVEFGQQVASIRACQQADEVREVCLWYQLLTQPSCDLRPIP